jgi:hypothetical protein
VVENCCSLQRLRLFGGRNAVSGEALAGLANLVNLRELDLGLCFNVSQHTLKELGSKLKLLVVLSLAGCPRVTMANLLYLCGCSSLEVCMLPKDNTNPIHSLVKSIQLRSILNASLGTKSLSCTAAS